MKVIETLFKINMLLFVFTLIILPTHILASSRIDISENHSLIISDDGQTVSSFGRNQFGQLGDGSFVDHFVPGDVSDLPDQTISQISAGAYHSALLTANGTVYTWGWNEQGQLGRTISVTNTDLLTELEALLDIPFTKNLRTAIRRNPEIYTLEGLLPYLKNEERSFITKNWDKANILYSALNYGSNHLSEFIQSDQKLKQQLTKLVTDKKLALPGRVYVPGKVKRIASGERHMVAVTTDGSVWTWGDNSYGQLGDHTTTSREEPAKVDYLNDVKQVVAGGSYSLALTEEGTVWAWGENWSGIFGNDVSMNAAPVEIKELRNIAALSSGKNELLLLKNDGTVWSLSLKNENTSNLNIEQKQIDKLVNIIAIASGDNFHLALKNDGTVWAWGENSSGQLGDGTLDSKLEPIQIPDLKKITEISAGPETSFAIGEDDQIYGWGNNRNGQLGLINKDVFVNPQKIEIIWIKSIDLYPSDLILSPGQRATLKVVTDPQNAKINQIKWTSQNDYLVTVDENGTIQTCRFCSGGTSTITATVNDRFQDSIQVKVVKTDVLNDILIYVGDEQIRKQDSIWLGLGETLPVTVKNQDKVIWTSSDPESVKVKPTGQSSTLTAATLGGKATITATSLYEHSRKKTTDTIEVKTYPWKKWEKQTTSNRYKAWKITFNKSLDQSSITTDTVYVLDEKGRKIESYITSTNSTITIKPRTNFQKGKLYNLFISKNIVSGQTTLKNGIHMPFEIK